MAAMTFAETLVRAYAERAVKAIEVQIERGSGEARLSFYGRSARVSLRDLVVQEDAFAALGNAVNDLLGIPRQETSRETRDP
jgi:hypothetical protein